MNSYPFYYLTEPNKRIILLTVLLKTDSLFTPNIPLLIIKYFWILKIAGDIKIRTCWFTTFPCYYTCRWMTQIMICTSQTTIRLLPVIWIKQIHLRAQICCLGSNWRRRILKHSDLEWFSWRISSALAGRYFIKANLMFWIPFVYLPSMLTNRLCFEFWLSTDS